MSTATSASVIGNSDQALKSSRQTPFLLRPVMPELDSIRGLAILAVLFYHGFFWGIDVSRFPTPLRLILTLMWVGRLGVNLFFVLSGFLITGLLIDSTKRPDYYSRFYTRRALRILPAYLLTILLLIALTRTPRNFIGLSLLYLSNLTPLFGIAIAYPILWSLAVEEHFYFVWPAVVRKLTTHQLMLCCTAIIACSPLSRLVTFFVTRHAGMVSFVGNDYTWNSADGLACGALLSVWLRTAQPTRRQLWTLVVILITAGIGLYLIGLPWGIWTRQRPIGAALQVVPWHLFFVALLVAFLLLGTSQWNQIPHSRTLRFFGEISYGLYLYHLLCFQGFDYLASRSVTYLPRVGSIYLLLTRFLVAASVAIALSYASRKQFEDRFLRLKSRLTSA